MGRESVVASEGLEAGRDRREGLGRLRDAR
jgi:hypothetical protein